MKTYVVQLEDHDDVISAGDKITWSKARRVLLIWPRAGRVLERQVDLLLLQRRCQALGAQFAVVTNSGAVRANARALGISVFASAEQAQRANWRVSRATQAGGRTALWQGRKPLPAQALREHYLLRSNDERQRLEALLNLIRLGILFIDHDRRVLYHNRAMLEIWGYPPETQLVGCREAVLRDQAAAVLADPPAYFDADRIEELQDAVLARVGMPQRELGRELQTAPRVLPGRGRARAALLRLLLQRHGFVPGDGLDPVLVRRLLFDEAAAAPPG